MLERYDEHGVEAAAQALLQYLGRQPLNRMIDRRQIRAVLLRAAELLAEEPADDDASG